MRPVLFLDFDGVMNSKEWFHKRPHQELAFDPVLVSRVSTICQSVDANVVVSSSWRRIGDPHRGEAPPSTPMEGVLFCRGVLRGYGFRGRIVDVTPSGDDRGSERGWEIQAWLDAHPEYSETPFAILDDGDDMVHLKLRLVLTPWNTGIQTSHVKRAIELLGGPA